VLISFNHNGARYPEVADYTTAVTAFRAALLRSGIVIPEFTAWNEPNHRIGSVPTGAPWDNPARAAEYWNALNRICITAPAGQGCVVAAGDFHDPEVDGGANFADYVRTYKATLNATPSVWAIHPYRATTYQDYTRVNSWIADDTGSADVWFTEVGAMYCEARPTGQTTGGGYTGDARTPASALAYQDSRATTLKNVVVSSRVKRTYYYTLGWPSGADDNCDDADHIWDSALLRNGPNGTVIERPSFRTLFPSAPTPVPPTVRTSPASGVDGSSATLNGTVNPNGLTTTYRFEYGTTAGYGGSTPAGSVGDGRAAVGVNAVIRGLRPGTTYHFRVVASNQLGETHGADQTFTTKRAVTGDYDGDGSTDLAIYAPSSGQWYIRHSSTGSGPVWSWGGPGDVPVTGDYDGDAKADTAIWAPSSGQWYIRHSSTDAGYVWSWGAGGDIPVPADYDGDNLTDIAIFAPSSGQWYVRHSSTDTRYVWSWGASGDIPVPADYDGDGKADIAIFAPSSGQWYIRYSSTGSGPVWSFGASGDIPAVNSIVRR
jgi:hypothetical protein